MAATLLVPPSITPLLGHTVSHTNSCHNPETISVIIHCLQLANSARYISDQSALSINMQLSRAVIGAAADSFLNRQPPADVTMSAKLARNEFEREHESSSVENPRPQTSSVLCLRRYLTLIFSQGLRHWLTRDAKADSCCCEFATIIRGLACSAAHDSRWNQ